MQNNPEQRIRTLQQALEKHLPSSQDGVVQLTKPEQLPKPLGQYTLNYGLGDRDFGDTYGYSRSDSTLLTERRTHVDVPTNYVLGLLQLADDETLQQIIQELVLRTEQEGILDEELDTLVTKIDTTLEDYGRQHRERLLAELEQILTASLQTFVASQKE